MKNDLSGAKVERVGDGIQVTFGAGILFDVDKYDLRSDARTEIAQMAAILAKYPDTYVRIEGHTDSDGSESYNQTLSERRASAVTACLTEKSVSVGRMKNFGFGETRPVASNETADGKQANRRVEVIIEPNEELRRRRTRRPRSRGSAAAWPPAGPWPCDGGSPRRPRRRYRDNSSRTAFRYSQLRCTEST